jgi:macrolide-specific efflux system membrane fusion protein
MQNTKTKWRIAAGLLALSCAAYGAYHVLATPKARFLTEPVTRADVESVVRAIGQVRPLQEVDVGTRANGELLSLKVKVGDKVVRGQLLAEIDPEEVENSLRGSRAELDSAKAKKRSAQIELALQRKVLARAQALRSAEAGSQADFEAAQAAVQKQQNAIAESEAQIKRSTFEVETAAKKRADTQVKAPMDGVVTVIPIKQGQTILSIQSAQVILTIADLSTMKVETRVSEADVARVKAGQKVRFSVLSAPDVLIDATVREVEPAPAKLKRETSEAVYYNAIFDVDNASGALRPLMNADVSIIEGAVSQVLTVPFNAVTASKANDTASVMVLEKGVPVSREIRTGMRGDTRIEVLSGLSEGERVVIGDMAASGQTDVSL